MNYDLFSDNSSSFVDGESLHLPDADLTIFRQFLSAPLADALFQQLRAEISWQQERIQMYGQSVDIPRLSAWYGDAHKVYTYSGLRSDPLPWTAGMLEIKKIAEQRCEYKFNSALANLYRDGSDGVAWHSDNESELGRSPVIGSVSLGESRTFQMKHKTKKNLNFSMQLEAGSLLLMKGETQNNWLHQVPKTTKALNERINLTFRFIFPST